MTGPDVAEVQRWRLRRTVASLATSGLLLGSLALIFFAPVAWLRWTGVVMVFVAIPLRFIATRYGLRAITRASGTQWWVDRKSGRVEQRASVLSRGYDGPYQSAEDAARSAEIARTRAAAWNAED